MNNKLPTVEYLIEKGWLRPEAEITALILPFSYLVLNDFYSIFTQTTPLIGGVLYKELVVRH